MEIRPLRLDDAPALLEFELANRSWFERHVEPRNAETYSPAGIRDHIAHMLADVESGKMLPFVLCEPDGRIVGRANLKDIDKHAGVAEIGYRIAEHATGQGLATKAVQHLVDTAAALGLERLIAVISVANGASARVIERIGFSRTEFCPAYAILLNDTIDCWRYLLAIRPRQT